MHEFEQTLQTRRSFLSLTATMLATAASAKVNLASQPDELTIMTVRGPIPVSSLGKTLIHEHILVDFVGANKISNKRWNREVVIQKVLPLLIEVKRAGVNTFVDCTPNYLGRDVQLLKTLSERSSLAIITNTGYYGGSDTKFLPEHAFEESAEELSARWVREWTDGIEGTTIKPGFIKISVNNSNLSKISTKLITAAALTHKQTGLTIASHTGPALPAYEQLEILKDLGVKPDAFIWVHAQAESDRSYYAGAAKRGCWVSLDGVSPERMNEYLTHLIFMKNERCLHRTLISHDAGWYDPAQKDGGRIRGYTTLTKELLPALREHGFTDADFDQLLISNPKEAFGIKTKLIEKK